LIVDALVRLRVTLPLPRRGIDTDNGSEFINQLLTTSWTIPRPGRHRSRERQRWNKV